MKTETLLDRARGCLAGLALGDALGMPVEIMTAKEIRQALGPSGVQVMMKPIQNRIEDTADLPAGSTTDDTQLARALAVSLIRRGEFDLRDQAEELVAEWRRSTFGWGRTTTRSTRQIAEALERTKDLRRRDFQHIAPPPTKKRAGAGNGVAMRIAPLALFRFVRDSGFHEEPLISQVMDLGMMTHGDPRASFAALAVAGAIGQVMTAAEHGVTHLNLVRESVVSATEELIKIAEYRYQFVRRMSPFLSERLAMAYRLRSRRKPLLHIIGAGCFCLESVPFSLAMAVSHLSDFREALTATVNCGGDTDTNAAMVGAIVGAHVGLDGLPADWLRQVPDAMRMGRLADELVMAALR